MYHSDWSRVSMKEKVSSSLDCLRMLVMKHFNTHNIWPRDISELLTPKTKHSDHRFYMHCVKRYLLCANRWQVMFWFVMYVNESIKSTHRECVRFQGSNFVALFTFSLFCFFSSCSRFGGHYFHCDTDQLWMHTQSNNKTKCLKQILLTVNNLTPHLRTFWHEVIYIKKWT